MDKNVSIVDKDGNLMGIKLGAPSDPETADFIPYIQEIPGGFYSMLGRNHYVHLSYSGSESYRVSITPTEGSSGNAGSGSVVIRQDIVSGETVQGSVTVPSIPVSDGTTISTDIGPDGSVDDVQVDNEGDGSVDYVVPSIPTENPQSPVQDDDNANSEIIPDVEISKSYGYISTNANLNKVDVPVFKEEIALNIIDTDIKDIPIADPGTNPDSLRVGQELKGTEPASSGPSDISIDLTASSESSDIDIPWLKILNIILVSIITSFVLYKFIYKVK